MALIQCPKCGQQISDKAPRCVHCGVIFDPVTNRAVENYIQNYKKKRKSRKPFWPVAVPLIIALLIIGTAYYFVTAPSAKELAISDKEETHVTSDNSSGTNVALSNPPSKISMTGFNSKLYDLNDPDSVFAMLAESDDLRYYRDVDDTSTTYYLWAIHFKVDQGTKEIAVDVSKTHYSTVSRFEGGRISGSFFSREKRLLTWDSKINQYNMPFEGSVYSVTFKPDSLYVNLISGDDKESFCGEYSTSYEARKNRTNSTTSSVLETPSNKPGQITLHHSCEAGNCTKEGTKAITGLSGKTEYYCEQHYKEMLLDIVGLLIDSTSSYSSSAKTSGTSSASMGEKNALRTAQNYLSAMGFSYSGLIEQLEYEGYSHSESKYAADNCGANWKEQAARVAKSYLNAMPFSRSGLIEQLQFEGFTYEQAVYGVEKNGY